LHPILDNLEKQYPSVQVLRYELDENLKLVKDLKVKLLPTLLFYKDGQLVWTHDGIESEDNLQKLFQTYASR
ncbi:MAG: thioredoxin family protein, partial [Prevotella sp.]|nr:thioredoxin family protein [Prevotella sp.]